MKRRTKIGVALAAVAIVVLMSVSVVSAQRGGGGSSGEQARDRAAEILGVDPSALKDALVQARREVKEKLIHEKLAAAVADGTITEAEAAGIRTWIDARPNVLDDVQALKLSRHHHRRGFSDAELERLVGDEVITQDQANAIAEWRDARPEAVAELKPDHNDRQKFRRGHGRKSFDREAIESMIQAALENGEITQEEADAKLEWLNSKKDLRKRHARGFRFGPRENAPSEAPATNRPAGATSL